MANLFIIGNGFDLANNLKTSYDDFRSFLLDNYVHVKRARSIRIPQIRKNTLDVTINDAAVFIYRIITQTEGLLWRDVEHALGEIDYTPLFEENFNNYQDVIQGLACSLPKIQFLFEDWIKSINEKEVCRLNKFENLINPYEDLFVTFNYTDLLEVEYGAKKVCHIHGTRNGDIIFGHGNTQKLRIISNSKNKNNNTIQRRKQKEQKKADDKNAFIIQKEPYIKSLSVNYLTLDDISMIMRCIPVNTLLYSKLWDIQQLLLRSDSNIIKTQKEHNNENETLLQIEEALEKVHSMLHKDTKSALQRLAQFIGSNMPESIDCIYSIGFSFSPTDMKAIQLIDMIPHTAWSIDSFNIYLAQKYRKELMHFGNNKGNIFIESLLR